MKLIENYFENITEQEDCINTLIVGTGISRDVIYTKLLERNFFDNVLYKNKPKASIFDAINHIKKEQEEYDKTQCLQGYNILTEHITFKPEYTHKEYKKGEKHLSSGFLNKSKQNETFRKNRLKRKKR